jgi:hypothetical protein
MGLHILFETGSRSAGILPAVAGASRSDLFGNNFDISAEHWNPPLLAWGHADSPSKLCPPSYARRTSDERKSSSA